MTQKNCISESDRERELAEDGAATLPSKPARPVITWLVLVYDRNADVRFPLKRKWYRFNYDKATPDEVEQVLALVKWRRPKLSCTASQAPVGEWQATYELSSVASATSSEILRYRRLFDFVPEDRLVTSNDDLHGGFMCVSLPPESYFEDENGHPISLTEIFDAEAQRTSGKNTRAIVFDYPESVLRHSPAAPLRPELWTPRDAESLAQFFDVYRQLIQSRWIKSPCSVSPRPGGKCDAILPVEEDCRSIVLPFRQLYSKDSADDLFNRCCNLHNRHCPPGHPYFVWVDHYKARFNSFLNHSVRLPAVNCSITAQRYLDAFAYGVKLVHASAKDDTATRDVEALLSGNPQELVVLAYHHILQTLLGYVSMTLPILEKNVAHWVNDLGWKWEPRVGSGILFG